MSTLETTGLLHATMELKNKSGEIIFKMKRKDDYGSLFYVFEKNEDLMSSEEKENFAKAFELISISAAYMGTPLYDSKELIEGIAGKTQILLRTRAAERARKKADKTGKTVLVRDIDIKVFDHATGRINNLTVGISMPPGGSEYIEKLLADL